MKSEPNQDAATRDGEELARSILKRLDDGVPLSRILPSARRLAEMQGDLEGAFWLEVEDVGLEGIQRARKGIRRPPHEEAGLMKFVQLHGTEDLDVTMQKVERALETAKFQRNELPERDMVMYQSVTQLEATTPPVEPQGASRYSGSLASVYGHALLFYREAQRVLGRVRSEVYAYVSRSDQAARYVRRLVELFGPDAIAVFAAGGPLLGELVNAAETIGRPGLAATSAMQARTALLTLGRELKAAGGKHVARSGETHDLQQELNRLHARLDELRDSSDDPLVQQRLEDAHTAAKTAYRLGSRGKNPSAITHDQALEAIRAVYAVAHAICFAGGFPPPISTTP